MASTLEKVAFPVCPPTPVSPITSQKSLVWVLFQPSLGTAKIAYLKMRIPKLSPRGQRGTLGGSASPSPLRSQRRRPGLRSEETAWL